MLRVVTPICGLQGQAPTRYFLRQYNLLYLSNDEEPRVPGETWQGG